MGAVEVHDRRPGSESEPVDEYGYGPGITVRHCWRQLHVGDIVRLPDGSRWPVVTSRVWRTGRGWRQAVAVGQHLVAAQRPTSADWAALGQLAN